MPKTTSEQNKALVLEAFDTLFNKRDYAAAEKFWSPHYIQHSAHIAPGREGLFNLIKSIQPTLKYEPGTIVAEKDFVICTGGSQASASRSTGLQQTLFVSRTGFLSSIGMLSRTKPLKSSQRAVVPCSETSSRSENENLTVQETKWWFSRSNRVQC